MEFGFAPAYPRGLGLESDAAAAHSVGIPAEAMVQFFMFVVQGSHSPAWRISKVLE